MTELIAHRKNTLAELCNTPTKYGVEVDIRSYGEELIIHHDPFIKGELFVSWLEKYRHGTLILNVKEEGLETRLIECMKTHDIKNYFFLDQSFPFLVKWSKLGEHRCAARVSEFESIETALNLAGKINWVWIDCFSRFPLDSISAKRLQDAGFKLCLVSPELQGRNATTEIPQLSILLNKNQIRADAICTKFPELWEKEFSGQLTAATPLP